jgi:unsaturated chondroitin disaccharide hydrolase
MIDASLAISAATATIERNMATFATDYPADATEYGRYRPRPARDGNPTGTNFGWTTGFWPGMLWLAYETTGNPKYRAAGETHVQRFADRLRRRIGLDHHDLGFLYTLSCVAAWRLARSGLAERVAEQAAEQLLTRWLPGPGVLQAWGRLDDTDERGRTIIDSLMNLPLLYWASLQTGDNRYAQAATRHAEQVMEHMVRPDGSTWHTYFFDADSGAPRFGRTHQGHRDESTWARGQAWAVYGFALVFAYTCDTRFRAIAERCADVFVAHLPADGIAYWDFDFSDGSGEPRDSSAVAIAACGLLELGTERHRKTAERAIEALWDKCATRGSAASDALLLRGTQNRNTGAGVDEGNLWGDYFYLEALTRLARPDWTRFW